MTLQLSPLLLKKVPWDLLNDCVRSGAPFYISVSSVAGGDVNSAFKNIICFTCSLGIFLSFPFLFICSQYGERKRFSTKRTAGTKRSLCSRKITLARRMRKYTKCVLKTCKKFWRNKKALKLETGEYSLMRRYLFIFYKKTSEMERILTETGLSSTRVTTCK